MSRSIPADSAGPATSADYDQPLIRVRHRGLLMAAVIVVSICQFIDSTIANVALPHIQVSVGASNDSVNWVLTSFIVAGAIFMPMTGWLSDRIGSRNLFMGATLLFLAASMACGAATTLTEMVVFRSIQGAATAFLSPMSQTVLLDISAPSKQASAMSLYGMMVMIAPISGPILGGYLTDYLSWRWVFYVNIPIGIPALALLWWLLPSRPIENRRLDLFGFAWIALALCALQLALDRGQQEDWLDSWEIIIELMIAISAFWIYLVHHWTSRDPLFNRRLFASPQFMAGLLMMFVIGITNIGLSAVLPTMYQKLYGYSVIDSGMLMAPRSIGIMITSPIVGWLLRWIDFRIPIFLGYLIAAGSLWMMTGWSLDMDVRPILISGFVQGLGVGMIFAPITMLAFSTVDPASRPDGSGMLALCRNVGSSFGLSIIVTLMARNQQVSHADIAANVTGTTVPGVDLPAVAASLPGIGDSVLAAADAEVNRQAAMIAYIDNFYLLFWIILAMAILPFLIRKPRQASHLSPVPME